MRGKRKNETRARAPARVTSKTSQKYCYVVRAQMPKNVFFVLGNLLYTRVHHPVRAHAHTHTFTSRSPLLSPSQLEHSVPNPYKGRVQPPPFGKHSRPTIHTYIHATPRPPPRSLSSDRRHLGAIIDELRFVPYINTRVRTGHVLLQCMYVRIKTSSTTRYLYAVCRILLAYYRRYCLPLLSSPLSRRRAYRANRPPKYYTRILWNRIRVSMETVFIGRAILCCV